MDSTAAQNKQVATAQAIPTSVATVSNDFRLRKGITYLYETMGTPQPSM